MNSQLFEITNFYNKDSKGPHLHLRVVESRQGVGRNHILEEANNVIKQFGLSAVTIDTKDESYFVEPLAELEK